MVSPPPLLSVEELSVAYAAVPALRGVSLQVSEGGVLAVLGPNGAGKSTLARAVSGLVPPAAGKVIFAGEDITAMAPHRIRRLGLVHLPEGRGIFPGLSVADNLRMAVRPVRRSERGTAIDRVVALFPVLGQRRPQLAGRLSGGEQQMLSLARGLAVQPRLMIGDELSLGLAPLIVDSVFENLERARSMGVTLIVIEQFVRRALALADRCCVLRRGSVAWQGPAAEAGDEVLERYLGTD